MHPECVRVLKKSNDETSNNKSTPVYLVSIFTIHSYDITNGSQLRHNLYNTELCYVYGISCQPLLA